MAEKMTDQITTFGGWAVALVTALITAILQWRKGNVDMTAQVMSEWKKLIDAHQAQISSMNTEIVALRERLLKAENRIAELEAENSGLKRLIAQNSQSTAWQLSRATKAKSKALPEDDDMKEQIEKLDRAGHNSTKGKIDGNED